MNPTAFGGARAISPAPRRYMARTTASLSTLLACGLMAAALPAHAAWPERPVTLVVGFAAGGPTDVLARAFARHASEALGKPVVVENRPGAGTMIAADAVARAKPDGYTLLMAATNHSMIPALQPPRPGFDARDSFVPICTLAISPSVLVAGPSMPVKTAAEFLESIRKSPDKHTYATPGTGSSGHFATEQFLKQVNARMHHIPYKGASQAITDVIGGQVDSSLATLGSVIGPVQAGQLRALAVASPQRLKQLPDVPTFAESVSQDYSADAWYGLLAPKGTPADITGKLEQLARDYTAASETPKNLGALGMNPHAVCGDAFGKQLSDEISTYSKQASQLGLSHQ